VYCKKLNLEIAIPVVSEVIPFFSQEFGGGGGGAIAYSTWLNCGSELYSPNFLALIYYFSSSSQFKIFESNCFRVSFTVLSNV
jgi:hypothetical protein